jgi:hypothetical protein
VTHQDNQRRKKIRNLEAYDGATFPGHVGRALFLLFTLLFLITLRLLNYILTLLTDAISEVKSALAEWSTLLEVTFVATSTY